MRHARGRSWIITLTIGCWVAVAAAVTASAPQARASESPPQGWLALSQAAEAVAGTFDDHQFVFLGSTHGSFKRHEFLMCLLSRTAFQERVTDVLVEWANPVHQELMDRYLLALEEMPVEALEPVWLDTDAPQLWARMPQIPEFFQRVRDLNVRLEPARRIRVLGGSEPIDWSLVRAPDDLARYPFKTNWAAHVITEHFATTPERRLLVVYGDGHIHRAGGTLISDVVAELPAARTFVVGTIVEFRTGEQEAVRRFGNPTEPFYLAAADFPSTGSLPDDLFYATSGALADHVDAVVYLGPQPDRNLAGSIELPAARRRILAEREALRGDRRALMEMRFERRDDWFADHPNDLDPRPQAPEPTRVPATPAAPPGSLP